MSSIPRKEKLLLACDKIIEFCVYGFVFFLPISNSLIEVCVGWSIFALLVKKITQRRFPRTHLDVFIGFYFLSLLISTIFSSFPQISLRTVFAKVLHYVAFYYAVAEVGGNKGVLKNILVVLSLSLLLVSIDGIQQYFTHFDFIRHTKWPWVTGNDLVNGRINACFTTANGLASFLAPVSILIFSLSFYFKRNNVKLYALLVFALAVICLFLTVTKSAWFAFGVALIVFALFYKQKKIVASIIIFIFAAGIMMYFANHIVKERIDQTIYSFANIVYDRKLLWQMSWNMFKDSPLWGQGIGTFMQNFEKFSLFPSSKQLSYAHNSYLQLLAEAGILGLGFFLAIIFIVLFRAIKIYFKNYNTNPDVIFLGFFTALLAFLIQAIFDNHFFSLTFSLLFWFLVGVISFEKGEIL